MIISVAWSFSLVCRCCPLLLGRTPPKTPLVLVALWLWDYWFGPWLFLLLVVPVPCGLWVVDVVCLGPAMVFSPCLLRHLYSQFKSSFSMFSFSISSISYLSSARCWLVRSRWWCFCCWILGGFLLCQTGVLLPLCSGNWSWMALAWCWPSLSVNMSPAACLSASCGKYPT